MIDAQAARRKRKSSAPAPGPAAITRADTAIRTAAKSKTNRSVLLLSRLNSNFVRVIGKYRSATRTYHFKVSYRKDDFAVIGQYFRNNRFK
jgi:hypothetical protein